MNFQMTSFIGWVSSMNRLQEFSDDIVVMPNRSKEEVDAGQSQWDTYT